MTTSDRRITLLWRENPCFPIAPFEEVGLGTVQNNLLKVRPHTDSDFARENVPKKGERGSFSTVNWESWVPGFGIETS